jgi:hypothetical protein
MFKLIIYTIALTLVKKHSRQTLLFGTTGSVIKKHSDVKICMILEDTTRPYIKTQKGFNKDGFDKYK